MPGAGRLRLAVAGILAMAALPTAAAREPARAARITFGGDVLLGRGVARRALATSWDETLAPLRRALAAEDAETAVVNLESPLGACLPGGTVQRPRLCGDIAAARPLRDAGVGAVTLANNHALDAGEAGLARTVDALRAAGVRSLGVVAARTGVPRLERHAGVAIVAANLTPSAHSPASRVPIPTPDRLARAVASARREPVIVVLHTGREHDPHPQPRDGRYVRAAVRAGADAVVMHGAHVVRALVAEGAAPVHLGLGNLLFDQRREDARTGALVTLSVGPRRVRVASVRSVVSHVP